MMRIVVSGNASQQAGIAANFEALVLVCNTKLLEMKKRLSQAYNIRMASPYAWKVYFFLMASLYASITKS